MLRRKSMAPADAFVLREEGRWSEMPLTGRDPVEIGVGDVLRWAVRPPRRRAGAVGEVDQVLEPVLPLMLWRHDGTLGLVPPGTDRFDPIDEEEVRVLDALVRRTTLAELASAAGTPRDRLRAVVDRLTSLGALEQLPPGSPLDEDVRPPDPILDAERKLRPRERSHPALAPFDPTRIPVVSVHLPRHGPPLALGMILAYARVYDGGRLERAYELRTPVTHDEARILLADHAGPAVLLLSNYVWSAGENLRLAAEVCAANPNIVAVHGGPHTPKYEEDERRYFDRPGVHVTVRGEGELTAAELLAALVDADRFGDLSGLHAVDGVTFRDPATEAIVRTADRERIHDLDELPSPYLTGEFDDLHPSSWDPVIGSIVVFETNRGCPYKCTFCDWGSLTMSRIRKFPLERVKAEMDWFAARGLAVWMVADANYGILPRDVEVTEHMVSIHREQGIPTFFGVNTAKNATRNLTAIVEMLCDEGITAVSSLALQSRDPEVLRTIERSNISVERYDDLAVQFRRRQLPILCDLIVGLPGATVDSFKADLQWCVDAEITPRAWVCQVLPNAPMNEPGYRAEHRIETDDTDVVISAATFSRAERQLMMDLRMAERIFEHLGLLRHVMRYLQWDLGILAVDVLERIARVATEAPERYPTLTWAQRYLDLILLPPLSWRHFYADVRRFLEAEFDVRRSPELDAVIDVQLALMPDRRRHYPQTVALGHDYVGYYQDAIAGLYRDGRPTGAVRPLASYPPGELTVLGDPARVVSEFRRIAEQRAPDLLPGKFWHISHFELDSPLTRWVAEVRATPGYHERPRADAGADPSAPGIGAGPVADGPVPVAIGTRADRDRSIG